MTTVTPPTPPAAPTSPPPPSGRSPRRGRALAAGAIAIAAVTVAVLVSGQGSSPGPDSTPASAPTPYTGPRSLPFVADGCLGGAGPEAGALGNPDLSKVVLAAQKAAPITEKGAAEFTAAISRWAGTTPRPSAWASAARQILAPDATVAAQKALAPVVTPGTTSRADFDAGRYHVDIFVPGQADAGARAVVSWTAAIHATGTDSPNAIGYGAAHLVAVGGVWRFQDQSVGLPLEELQRVGTPYAGGC